MPETLSSKKIYKGRTFDVRIDEIREDELTYEREIVVHKGSAVIVPLFDDGTIALVRQYRHATGKYLLESPAGSLEEGEDPLAGAIRELEEEIGVTAATVEKLSEFYVSPGFLTEKMYLYLATGLTETAQDLDDDERIDIVRMPLIEAVAQCHSGAIEDAKTIIGLLSAEPKIGNART
ncbi:MAG TPA: NUDIX hydrolase [Pyrinomonadaceae bacterium]|jgi:ADP-ribose pyrophosphatase|nr:NUDIX hydrolase [Pyrinomonadaceae bacterium]